MELKKVNEDLNIILRKASSYDIDDSWSYHNRIPKYIGEELKYEFSAEEIQKIGKIAIIGGGWYGCHIAHSLKNKGFDVHLYEKNGKLLDGSSGKSQFRLHLGFHYPRAYVTRMQALFGFARMLAVYPSFSYALHENVFAVAAEKSLLDFQTYIQVCAASHLPFSLFDGSTIGLKGISGAIICPERAFYVDVPQDYFTCELSSICTLNCAVKSIAQTSKLESSGLHEFSVSVDSTKYDWVINCTYNQSFSVSGVRTFFECCVVFLYEDVRSDKLRSKKFGVTVMDGPFVSLYPYTVASPTHPLYNRHLYTLTSVQHTPTKVFSSSAEAEAYRISLNENEQEISRIRSLFEEEVLSFLPRFGVVFKYFGFYTSLKHKQSDTASGRECVVERDKRVIHVYSGKINTIFHAEDVVFSILKEGS